MVGMSDLNHLNNMSLSRSKSVCADIYSAFSLDYDVQSAISMAEYPVHDVVP